MPFTTTPDGIRLYYETAGTGDPLLLVAGRNSDHHLWDFVRDDLTAHYQVILYDQRGTGQSDKPEQPPYTVQGFAQDAIAVLDQLGIERAHAYGVSMGGCICQWLGINHPSRIGALVLGCTTPGGPHQVSRTPDVARLIDTDTNPIKTLSLLFSPWSSWWVMSHLNALFHKRNTSTPIPAYTRQYHHMASNGHNAWDVLPTIHAPTLVIHGSNDRVNPTANAYLLAQRIPNAELYIVKGGRHMFFIEFRQEASRVVNDFLARHPLNSL